MSIYKPLVFAFCVSLALPTFGQSTNKMWAFGWGAGLDFNTTPPSPFLSAVASLEGVASVSDASGKLLMYTYGDTVYNSLHKPMPNGGGILGTATMGSCTQGSLIIPKDNRNKQFYVFSLEGLSDGLYTGRLYYSVVDMTLNAGLGDVVTSSKHVLIDTLLGEKLTAVAGPCGVVWVLVIPFSCKEFHTFKVTSAGVNPTPIISPLPTPLFPGDYDAWVLKANHKGTKLVAANYKKYNFDVFDFNSATGLVSGPLFTIPNSTMYSSYGACFSPDDSKLYVTMDSIYQYNMTLASSAAIIASRISLSHSIVTGSIPSSKVAGDMQLGPDGKIYLASQHLQFLSTIEFPNLAGLSCKFMPASTPLHPASKSILGLPNVVINLAQSVSRRLDTTVCQSFTAVSSSVNGPYLWSTGDTSRAIKIKDPGLYWVSSSAACGTQDTIKVTWLKIGKTIDTAICQSFTAKSSSATGPYLWNTGDTTRSLVIKTPGSYWVSTNVVCGNKDTFNVSWLKIGKTIDTAICRSFIAKSSSNAGPYLWNTGDTSNTLIIANAGLYWVTSTYACGSRDTFNVSWVDNTFDISDISVCEGKPVNIPVSIKDLSKAFVKWSTGDTLSKINITDTGRYWVEINQYQCVSFDSFEVTSRLCGCELRIPNAFTPNGDGNNDLFRPLFARGDCAQASYYLQIYNRYGQRIFQGRNTDKGWDGQINGIPAELGVYYYYVQIVDMEGKSSMKGDVSLLR